MLEGLDAVDWSKLGHAYGPAEGVPALLRSLQSRDAGELEGAFYDLYGSLCHQGTVYSATAAAVPFLLELFADPGLACRGDLAAYLVSLAYGYGEAADVGGVRRALGAGAGVLRGLLAAPEPEVRAAAGWALAGSEGASPAEALAARARVEPDPKVRDNLLLALGRVAAAGDLERLLPADAGLAGQLARAHAAGPELTAAQAEALARALLEGDAYPRLAEAVAPFLEAVGTPAEDAVAAASAQPAALLPALGGLLEACDDEDEGLRLANAVLDAALPQGARVPIDQAAEVPLLTRDQLSPAQREALAALARADAAWGYGNIWLDLRKHGLPGEREELCALLGVGPVRRVLVVEPGQVPAAAQVAEALGRTDWLTVPFLFSDGPTPELDEQVPEDPDDFPRPVMEAAGKVAAALYRACVAPVRRSLGSFRFYPQLTTGALLELCRQNGWELHAPDLAAGARAAPDAPDAPAPEPAAPARLPTCLTWPKLAPAQQARAEAFCARLAAAGWKEAQQSLGFAKQVGDSGVVVSPLCTARRFGEAADLEAGYWVVEPGEGSPLGEFVRLAVVSKAGDDAMVFRLAAGERLAEVLEALIATQAALRPDDLAGAFTEQVLARCERILVEGPDGLVELGPGA